MDILVNRTDFCCMCLNCFKSPVEVVSLRCCKAILQNPERKDLLSNIFGSLSITVFSDCETANAICHACDEQILTLAQFFETCINSQEFFKQQIKTEVDPDDVKELLTSVQAAEHSEDSNQSDEVPLSILAGCVKKEQFWYECQQCPKRFKNAAYLANHSYKHTGDPPHPCDYCKKKFRTVYKLKNHTVKAHTTTPCPQCGLEYKNVEALREHQISEHGKEMFKCLTCLESFDDIALLNNHEETHAWKLYDCYSCDETFNSRDLWLKHSARQKPKSMRGRYFCECGKSYTKHIRLAEHRAKVHENRDITRFHCNECGKRFLHRHAYMYHKNIHLGLKPYPCKMCQRSYPSPGGLQQHINKVHKAVRVEQSRRFLCDNCGQSFSRKSHLQRHLFRKHTPNAPRNIPCEVCGKQFKDNETLKKHILLHFAVKNVSCGSCDRMFYRKSAMIAHVKRIHLGLRPFPCTSCNMRFKIKAHLEKHLRTHTGEKPFQCPLCPYCCAEKSNLTKHVKIHSRDK